MPQAPKKIDLVRSFDEMGKQYVDLLNQTRIDQLALSRKTFHPRNPDLDPEFEKKFDNKPRRAVQTIMEHGLNNNDPKISLRFQQQEAPDSPGKFTKWERYRL